MRESQGESVRRKKRIAEYETKKEVRKEALVWR